MNPRDDFSRCGRVRSFTGCMSLNRIRQLAGDLPDRVLVQQTEPHVSKSLTHHRHFASTLDESHRKFAPSSSLAQESMRSESRARLCVRPRLESARSTVPQRDARFDQIVKYVGVHSAIALIHCGCSDFQLCLNAPARPRDPARRRCRSRPHRFRRPVPQGFWQGE